MLNLKVSRVQVFPPRTESAKALLLEQSIQLDHSIIEKYTGVYERPSTHYQLSFRIQDNEMWLHDPQTHYRGRLIAIAKTKFELLDADEGYEAVLDDSGNVTMLLIRVDQVTHEFHRIED